MMLVCSLQKQQLAFLSRATVHFRASTMFFGVPVGIVIGIVLQHTEHRNLRVRGCTCVMSKRRKQARNSKPESFSVENLRKETEEEMNQEAIGAKILDDIRSINLNRVGELPVDIIICALIVKYGLILVCALANVVPSLCVLPINVRREVINFLCPELLENEANMLFQCVSKLKLPSIHTDGRKFHVFAPPCGHCLQCNSSLVRHNNPVKVKVHDLLGTHDGIKVSLKCNRCSVLYGYSKFGSPQEGWKLYPESRTMVEATDVCFVDRTLLKWQISLA